MPDDALDLEAIRGRAKRSLEIAAKHGEMRPPSHDDRDALLAEVDRLRAVLASAGEREADLARWDAIRGRLVRINQLTECGETIGYRVLLMGGNIHDGGTLEEAIDAALAAGYCPEVREALALNPTPGEARPK